MCFYKTCDFKAIFVRRETKQIVYARNSFTTKLRYALTTQLDTHVFPVANDAICKPSS